MSNQHWECVYMAVVGGGVGGAVLEVVRFESALDKNPKPWRLTWDELVEALSKHETRGDKDGPAWSPVTYKPGTTRGVKNVEKVTVAVFDVDHVPQEKVEAMGEALGDQEHLLHSSFSSTPNDIKLRLVIPLAQPQTPSEWAKTRPAMLERFCIPADPATKDASRLFYLPAHPPGVEPLVRYVQGAGKPYEVPAPKPKAASKPRPKPSTAFLGDGIDYDALKACLRLARKPETVALVQKLLAGEPLGAVGERDLMLHRAAGVLVYALPKDTPMEAYLELLRPSLEAMESDHGLQYELDKAEEKINRAAKRRQADLEEEAVIRRALRWDKSPDVPQSNLERWAKEQGTTPEGMKDRWIISKGRSFFVFGEEGYQRPIAYDDLAVSIPRDFRRMPINLHTETKNGEVKKLSVPEILSRYSTVAREIRSSIALQTSYYDAKTMTFHEAVCPLRKDIAPTFHQDVQDWLSLLGGGEAGILLDWVAGVTKLDRQCAALFLEGEYGTGKTLLAAGLSRLWCLGGATEFSTLIADFNEAVARCPLVLADEGFPKKKDFSVNDELRRWTGSMDRTFRRKYVADSTLEGSIRLLLTANNDRILDGIEEMSEADRGALAQRLIYIKVGDEARKFFESGEEGLGDEFKTKKIAEHALWLRDNREITHGGKRFLVEGKESPFHNRLSINNGLNPHLCEFIVGMIMDLNPQSAKTHADRIIVGGGKVFVATKLFTDEMAWKQRVPGTKPPASKAVHRSLENMRIRQVQIRVPSGRPYYNEINTDLLVDWTKQHKDHDPEELMARIAAPNELVSA